MKKQQQTIENIEGLYPKREFDFTEENGIVTVLFYEKNPSLIEKIFFKKRLKKPKKIELDKIGSFVWVLCDGTKNVAEITKLAKEKFNEEIEPAKERTELFIERMFKYKIIQLYRKID